MSDKYIIRNCPALVGCRAEQDLCYKNELHKCQDCTDCVMKQIVELCKEDYISENNVFDISKKMFAQRILDKLDIHEVE